MQDLITQDLQQHGHTNISSLQISNIYMDFSLRVFLLGPCHHTYIKGIGLS